VTLLGPLAFLNPWLCAALVLLPALWWLLKVTPPAARRHRFPAIRLLADLTTEERTAAHTPLWLALLRLLLAALVILALAHPVLRPPAEFAGAGPVLMALDDGWASGPDWTARQKAALDLLARAEDEGRDVMLLPTAPPETGEAPAVTGPVGAAEARRLVQALLPKPWPTGHREAIDALARFLAGAGREPPGTTVWISDGLDDADGSAAAFADKLQSVAPLTVLSGARDELPHLLLPPPTGERRLTARAARATAEQARVLTARAVDDAGATLAQTRLDFAPGQKTAESAFDLPTEIANRAARIEIANEPSAGAVVLLDDRWRRKVVGLVSAAPSEAERPLLGDLYFLDKALKPRAEIRTGALSDLVAQNVGVLVLADVAALSQPERAALANWVGRGGVLVRFAGPRMAQAAEGAAGEPRDDLLPVRLRQGGRALGGVMSWTAPMALAPFEESSPFAGLSTRPDVQVQRQVLAEPTIDLGGKTWASLSDGTPLVTGERRGEGWVVLFHVTANTEWSNLPLSGLFVEMLGRVVDLSKGTAGVPAARPLPPFQALDGLGRLGAPPQAALPFAPTGPKQPISPRHPPGWYGTAAARVAVNLSADVTELRPLARLPSGATAAALAGARTVDLKPWLWLAAIAMAFVDLAASLWLRGLMPRIGLRRAGAAAVLFALALASAGPAAAQAITDESGDAFALKATSATRLAYVLTGDPATDETSRAGLAGLSYIVNRRTAAELAEPMGVDPERDEILFFPLLYWPVGVAQKEPSAAALARLNKYLGTGGTILFDTGDQRLGSSAGRGAFAPGLPGAANLRRIVRGLEIPPLVPVPPDHALTRAYYLMHEFPGRYAGGTLWVAADADAHNDGVSPIIVGANDFTGAWALDSALRPLYAVVPGGSEQREMAFRFGINLVMYALTGNYKTDQVHVPAILERLGQ
jgi:hypothetical protein